MGLRVQTQKCSFIHGETDKMNMKNNYEQNQFGWKWDQIEIDMVSFPL